MAQQVIGLGTVANDGTGDSLRVGGDKINDNFSEVYGYSAAFPQFTTATSTTDYTGTPSPAITAYATGQRFQVKIHAQSTGSATLNLNGLGAKKVFVTPTTQASTSDLVLNQIYLLFYDSALDSAAGGFLMIGGSGAAIAADKLDSQGTFRRLTANHTLDGTDLTSITSDQNLFIEMNVGSANTVTIPLNATQGFPIGTVINVTQYGAGQTSFLATGGVTINPSAGPGALNIPSRYTPAVIVKVGTDEWYLFNGSVSPSVPTWQDWSASLAPTGFSSVATQLSHYTDDGVTVHIWVFISGTSNATGFTFALPIAISSSYGSAGIVMPVFITDNTTTSAFGRIVINGAGSVVTVDSTVTGNAFTAANTKSVRLSLFYEK